MHSLSLVTRVIILYIWFFKHYMLFHIKNFYTPLVNLMLISLLYKIKGLCALIPLKK